MITDPRIGTELAGYRIESVLGHGGMGVVYVARHLRLDRTVALKVVSAELAEDPRFRDRFVRESRLAASLEHPNIVPIHDAGEADGVLYLAMRLVHGADLKSLIQGQNKLDPARVVRVLEQVAGALDAAHQAGLVHRDVKPGNVLVASPGTPGEHAYLSDFGLTKRMTSDSGLTGTGQFVGTLDYAAPEQFEGKQLDGRTDVYSLGCVLFECLAGDIPFRRDNQAGLVYAHLMAPPPKVTDHRPELPEDIDRVVDRAMAKGPENRYPSAGEVVEAAREALSPELAAAAPAPAPPLPTPGLRRRPLLLLGGGLAMVLALVVGVVLAGQRGGSPGASPSGSPSPTEVPLADRDRVVRISQAGSQAALARFAAMEAGKDPRAVALGEGSIWVANQGDATVSRIDPVTNRTEAVIEVGRRPVAIAFGEGSIWVVNRLNHSVSRIDTSRNEVIATIDLETTRGPSSIAVGEGAVWVAVDSDWPGPNPPEFHRIDPGSNRDVATIPGKEAVWVVVAAGEGAAWGADNSGRVFRIEPRTNERLEVTTLGVPAGAITVAEGSLWIGTVNGEVLRIDPATGQIEERMPGGGALVDCTQNCSSEVSTVGIAAGEGIIWVTDKVNGSISRVVAISNTPLQPIEVGQTPTGIAVGYGSVWVTVDSSA
jgi:YVTN family beta-propeller protein